ncbi:photosystem II complex extrinsic protein PsbU [Pantanalinema rosaneae CENA516]|uniref:photosystem II complex extrinsic protein PsbU n=1 Tax=Pantanalinema rosaneae TaxID=1620701 RepID=UPI003D6FD290
MKRVLTFLGCLLVFCWGYFSWVAPAMATPLSHFSFPALTIAAQVDAVDAAACPDFAQKIDLNNANIVAFTDCRGFYPTLATLIVQNSPYEAVEDVLDIPNLSDRQIALLKAQLKNFIVTEPRVSLEMRMPPRPPMP